jgi:hypothetical protein
VFTSVVLQRKARFKAISSVKEAKASRLSSFCLRCSRDVINAPSQSLADGLNIERVRWRTRFYGMTFWAFAKGRKQPSPPGPGKSDIPSTIDGGPKFTLHQRHKPAEKDVDAEYN